MKSNLDNFREFDIVPITRKKSFLNCKIVNYIKKAVFLFTNMIYCTINAVLDNIKDVYNKI